MKTHYNIPFPTVGYNVSCIFSYTGVILSKQLCGKPQILGGNVVRTCKCMGVFRFLLGGGARPGCPQKYTPMFSYTCLKGKNTRTEKATEVYIKRRSIIDSLIRYFVHSFIQSFTMSLDHSSYRLLRHFSCVADITSPHLEVPSAAAAAAADGDLDDGGDHSLIVSRGRDILTSTQTEVNELLCICTIMCMGLYVCGCVCVFACNIGKV